MKPRFPLHECKSECNCQICKDYINKLDDHRQSISRGEYKSKNPSALGQTSSSKIVGVGKRKFELPKPYLTRPFLINEVKP